MLIRSLLGALLLSPSILLATVAPEEPQEEPSKHAVDRYKDGWFWYKDPKPQVKPKKADAAKSSEAPQPAKHPALVAHEALQKELTESLQIATMDPSEENIARFLGAWYEARKKSSEFADFARTFSWANPQFSRIASTNGRPSNLMAIRVHDEEKRGVAKKRVASLAKTHGLFFVFKSDCPYCHTFSPCSKSSKNAMDSRCCLSHWMDRAYPTTSEPKKTMGQSLKSSLRWESLLLTSRRLSLLW